MRVTPPKKILLIRRDNIGDLLCTTPLFTALRQQYPQAHIALLANSYCAPVVQHNPDLDQIYIYSKAKHLPATQRPASYWARLRLVQNLRATGFDTVILAAASYYARGLAFSRWLPRARTIGFASDTGGQRGLDVALARNPEGLHEVEDLFTLLRPLHIEGNPPPTTLIPDPLTTATVRAHIEHALGADAPLAVHISARLPSNRWTSDHYIALIRSLIDEGQSVVLLWAPGAHTNPTHPGDDALAKEICERVASPRLLPLPTPELPVLIAALSVCQGAILSDGGAMHVAAALKRPVICFFGDSNATRWRPWLSPHILLQPASRQVTDISVADALDAARTLFNLNKHALT